MIKKKKKKKNLYCGNKDRIQFLRCLYFFVLLRDDVPYISCWFASFFCEGMAGLLFFWFCVENVLWDEKKKKRTKISNERHKP
jgi:hypothetical protein